MDDIRWFAPNRYCTLPVAGLAARGLTIALEGNAPARLAVAADGQSVVEAYEFSRRHRVSLVSYLWDLPPWRLGTGRPDHVFDVGGRIWRVPRLGGRYPERAGYYSRIGFAARRSAEVWCPSRATTDAVAERLGVAARELPFCYDSERFAGAALPLTTQLPTTPVRILSVSRLVPHKNHSVILRAAARLTPKPVVQLVGQGPEAGRLRALAAELGISALISDAWSSEDEVLAAYRSATVVVCPSRFEGFGLTPMEGIAMGRPVIASNIPPHREFLEGAVRFFESDDDAGLAREIDAVTRGAVAPVHPSALGDLTIEACVARWQPELERLLEHRR